MSEREVSYNDEIDLFELIQTIWSRKLSLIFCTMAAAAIGYGYTLLAPDKYEVSFQIEPAKSSYFVEYLSFNEVLAANALPLSINDEMVFDHFVKEFEDHEELSKEVVTSNEVLMVLENNLDEDKEKIIAGYVKKFKLSPVKDDDSVWLFKFEWSDVVEGQDILNRTIQNVLANVKTDVLSDVQSNIALLSNRKELKIKQLEVELTNLSESFELEKQSRSAFLNEQLAIAKSLGLKQNMLGVGGLLDSQGSEVLVNVQSTSQPYYLRGSDSIEAELKVLATRRLISDKRFVSAQSELLKLKGEDVALQTILAYQEKLIEQDAADWVNFDIAYSTVVSKKKTILIVALSLILGGMIGLFYVLFSSAVAKRRLAESG